jgi:carbonic anhydrase
MTISAETPEQEARIALQRLMDGNRRFVEGMKVSVDGSAHVQRMSELSRIGQNPFAVILSCSDSRAPSEILFDQGPGDLFIVRVAGNVVAPSLIGSIEMAAQLFNTRLVVVMGHTGCSAIKSTVDNLRNGVPAASLNIAEIIARVRPAIEPLVLESGPGAPNETVCLTEAVRANVRGSCVGLRRNSPLLDGLVADQKLWIVGGICHLETGEVDFFADIPPAWQK